MPVTWILFFLIGGIVSKKKKRRKRLLVTSMSLLLFFTNPFIINKILLKAEYPLVNINKVEPVELGIILTGFTQRVENSDKRVFLSKGGDRATHMVYLFNRGLVKHILVSGGNGALGPGNEIPESEKVKNLLIELGVPPQAISIETLSRNTYENAKFSATYIQKHYPNTKPILVTSARHLWRSIACFKKQNIAVTPVSCDLYSKRTGKIEVGDFLPNGGCLSIWESLFHEWVGFTVYKILGYA